MASQEEYAEFGALMKILLFILACFAIFLNSAQTYVILSKKLMQQPLFIFMFCFAISDILRSFTMICTEAFLVFPFELYSCKVIYSVFAIEQGFKPLLLSAVFVVYLIRPTISKNCSKIIIAVILVISVIIALPECYHSELFIYEYSEGSKCKYPWDYQPTLETFKALVQVAIPLTLIIAYYVVKHMENPWRIYFKFSKVQNMVLIMITIYLICWIPAVVITLDFHSVRWIAPKVSFDRHWIYFQFIHFSNHLASISMCYKPILLYIMNDEFKTAVKQVIRRDQTNFERFEIQENTK